ncbi:Male sterility NAD-binding [Penicillium angulare]|uniref:Male sterility NAD-binding n=1 Tax=Penicillium angulare TaxID=116970 RepID=UPI00253F7FCB|nr:Male sterility NAD-binding [Penicillium angulare]KAJ5287095.1 Male sterility NAD-binding [Penicillium angulare]
MWGFYNDKTILLTGGTGFVGTSILYRILSQATPRRVFLLLRGSQQKARNTWADLLSDAIADSLIQNPRITIVSGNLKSPNLGLSDYDWQCLMETVEIVVHTASPINLVANLKRMSELVISPTMFLANVALQMPELQRFVFISTAYSNSHLWALGKEDDVFVKECFYTFDTDRGLSEPASESFENTTKGAKEEWESIRTCHTTDIWEAFDFPWAYGYAKNLTERLLLEQFWKRNALEKFLIVKPSIIAPAKRCPFPGYARANSVPAAGFAAAILMSPGRHFKFASRASDPLNNSTLDEVPVDIVVDRLLVHLACGTSGVVHAVSGKRERLSLFGYIWPRIVKERPFPWEIKPVWKSSDWNSTELHLANRIFKLVGTSFDFEDTKTERLYANLSQRDKSDLDLFTSEHKPTSEERRAIVQDMLLVFGKKQHIPSFIIKSFFPARDTPRTEVPPLPNIKDNERL